MPELTLVEVLRRIDAPAEPQPAFADALLTSLLDELEGEPVVEAERGVERVPKSERPRPRVPQRWRPDRPWARIAVAVAAAIAVAAAVVVVVVRPPQGTPSALALMREARAAVGNLPPFRATTVQRLGNLVFERDIAFMDRKHFHNEIVGSSKSDGSPQVGEYWAADGEYFAHYNPSRNSFSVLPVGQERSLAFFSAGMLDPTVEVMADPGDAYLAKYCEALPDETMLGRTVHHIHCEDPRAPAPAVDTYLDTETGMLFKLEGADMGVIFEATSIDFEPTFTADDFALKVPEGATFSWTGGGTPPERFQTSVDASVTSIPVGTAPEDIVSAFGSVWVDYTRGGTGSNGVGGRQMVARIDPATDEVVARIEVPTSLRRSPWSSPLVFVGSLTPAEDGLFLVYHDAGNRAPYHVAEIDPATNTLAAPIITFRPSGEGIAGVSLTSLDGSLWVCDGQGGRAVDLAPPHPPWPYSAFVQVDPATGDVVQEIPIEGTASGRIFASGGYLWVRAFTAEEDDPQAGVALFKVDPVAGRVVSTIPIPDNAFTGHDDTTIWLRDPAKGTLVPLDPRADTFGAPVAIDRTDGDLAPADGLVWLTNSGPDTVTAVDPVSGTTVSDTRVGDGPWGLTVSDGSVWVANYQDGTVARIDIPLP